MAESRTRKKDCFSKIKVSGKHLDNMVLYSIIYSEFLKRKRGIFDMALIKCPECGRQVSDMASSCPQCGCPIGNMPTTIKVRALSDDKKVKYMIFLSGGRELARVPIGAVATINITKPTRITIRESYALMTSGDNGSFNAVPGKCYEAKFCKPGIAFWDTVVSEVSFIG